MSKKKDVEPLIYCGPSFAGQLQQFSIIKGEIPAYMDKYIEKCPAIKSLFVPPSKLAITRERLNKQGSRENQLYKSILMYQKEG